MKNILYFILILFSTFSSAQNELNIEELKFYQTNDLSFNKKQPFYLAYLKKDDPCPYVKDIEKNKTYRFCKMGNSGLDLEKDSPSVYVTKMFLSIGRFYFIVAAPWNEQKCNIFLPRMELTCESTGR